MNAKIAKFEGQKELKQDYYYFTGKRLQFLETPLHNFLSKVDKI